MNSHIEKNEKKKGKKLNPRQRKLYNYIKEHGCVNVEDICRDYIHLLQVIAFTTNVRWYLLTQM